ncbi:hypothetical protein LBMAG12_09840 [Actinomycetes bacterium]|nr:hypothetical protein LBMAG12_09840 [Actinomycetes bacterium]
METKDTKPKTKKFAVIGVTAGLLIGAGAGLLMNVSGGASASSAPVSTIVSSDDTNDDSDGGRGEGEHDGAKMDPAARQAKLREALQTLVDAGTLTSSQVEAIVAALEAARPAGDQDHESDDGHQGRGGPKGERRQEMLAAAAEVIGITTTELQTAVKSGQTIAEVAVANGKSVQSVIDALVAQATADITEHITDMVNGIHSADDDSAGE